MAHDVVIAGGGPVGLFLACELQLAGVSVIVLERMEDPHSPLKAGWMGMRGLNFPSVEAFYRRGLLEEVRARLETDLYSDLPPTRAWYLSEIGNAVEWDIPIQEFSKLGPSGEVLAVYLPARRSVDQQRVDIPHHATLVQESVSSRVARRPGSTHDIAEIIDPVTIARNAAQSSQILQR